MFLSFFVFFHMPEGSVACGRSRRTEVLRHGTGISGMWKKTKKSKKVFRAASQSFLEWLKLTKRHSNMLTLLRNISSTPRLLSPIRRQSQSQAQPKKASRQRSHSFQCSFPPRPRATKTWLRCQRPRTRLLPNKNPHQRENVLLRKVQTHIHRQ